MKKTLLLLFFAVTFTIIWSETILKFDDVVDVNLWSEGFSATLEITSNSPFIPSSTSKIYQKDENFRMDNDQQTIITRKQGNQIVNYFFNREDKTYFTMEFYEDDDFFDDMATTSFNFDDEDTLLKIVGKAEFAGKTADKYLLIEPDEHDYWEDSEKQYMFVDPSNRFILGFETNMEGFTITTILKDVSFRVDDDVFKPLEGYTETDLSMPNLENLMRMFDIEDEDY